MSFREGIILIDKPAGLTSHDVVDFVRRRFGIKKVGHAGTLDPMATGLLIVLIEGFTKKSIHFSSYDKEYEGRLCLGISSDTGDKEGKTIQQREWWFYVKDIGDIEKVFKSFCGSIYQIPPMYSAKKIKGEKLYKLARRGRTVEREPKLVLIKELNIINASLPYITFYVKCSKGTYIRQLAHDIGEKVGCGAHLVSLRRTKIGPFSITDAVPLDKITYEDILQSE